MDNDETINTLAAKLFDIAHICHAATVAYCESIGDHTNSVSFFEIPQEQACEAMDVVKFAIENPDVTASDLHNKWAAEKITDGWLYGEVKDEVMKTDPCCVPYEHLPIEQKRKDALFNAIVKALS